MYTYIDVNPSGRGCCVLYKHLKVFTHHSHLAHSPPSPDRQTVSLHTYCIHRYIGFGRMYIYTYYFDWPLTT